MSISDKIAIASLIVTVITLGIAIYALFTWKKQLKYNLIFDLEDKFNILIGDFIEEFEFNALIQYKIIKITSTDKKVIKELTEKFLYGSHWQLASLKRTIAGGCCFYLFSLVIIVSTFSLKFFTSVGNLSVSIS